MLNRTLSSLVAQVRVPRAGGKVANIDVLHKLFTVNGLKKSTEFTNRVIARSVQVKWSEGVVFRVMHPLDLLESRVHNAAGLLEDKGPHVLTQAKWAIKVAKAAVLKMAKDAALSKQAQAPGQRLGAALKAIHGLAHSRAGRTLHNVREARERSRPCPNRTRGQSAEQRCLWAVHRHIRRPPASIRWFVRQFGAKLTGHRSWTPC